MWEDSLGHQLCYEEFNSKMWAGGTPEESLVFKENGRGPVIIIPPVKKNYVILLLLPETNIVKCAEKNH